MGYGCGSRYCGIIAGCTSMDIVDPSGNKVHDDEIAVLLQQEFYDLDEYEMESVISLSYNNEPGTENIENDPYRNEIINYLVDEQVDYVTIVSEL